MILPKLKFNKTKAIIIFLLLLLAIAIVLIWAFIGEAQYAARDSWKYNNEAADCKQAKSVLEEKIKTSCPQINATLTPVSYLVTPTPKIKINFPQNEKWGIYPAKCQGFSKITIYYPSSWKLSTYGEEKVFDGYEDTTEGLARYAQECSLAFGYPLSPNSRQDPYIPGLQGYLRILTYPSINTIDDFIAHPEMFIFGGDATESVNRQTINNQEYLVVRDFSDNSIVYVRWATARNGKYYEIRLWVPKIKDLDPFTIGKFLDIGEEFVKRIEFH